MNDRRHQLRRVPSRTDRQSQWKSTANTKQVPLPTLGKADPLSLVLKTSKRALPPSGRVNALSNGSDRMSGPLSRTLAVHVAGA